MYIFWIWKFWVPWWYPKKAIIHKMAVMKYENSTCEGDSRALSTNLGTMMVPKNIWEWKYEIWAFQRCIWKVFIFLEAKIKALSNCKIFAEFYSKLGYFSCSLEKNTHKFRMTIFHFKINPCVKMLKWRATRHSKAEKLNFVLRKCKCSLGNSRWLILKSGYHAENP